MSVYQYFINKNAIRVFNNKNRTFTDMLAALL